MTIDISGKYIYGFNLHANLTPLPYKGMGISKPLSTMPQMAHSFRSLLATRYLLPEAGRSRFVLSCKNADGKT